MIERINHVVNWFMNEPTGMLVSIMLAFLLIPGTLYSCGQLHWQRCEALGYEWESVECYREVREPGSPIWQFVDEESGEREAA